ncbi:major facilitator superfamily domain-containing protein [Irpex rosettiformis]|uniref:Major facilitator superfamily domain-containing protein n=1 Tax=Irpex rosettiformis TaxID=378272 RepID=A0ACB8U6L8_9APHY|nr:major facilitator superfamily domain-containing protein [Irpex rosettiformis]
MSSSSSLSSSKPWGLRWRCSPWYASEILKDLNIPSYTAKGLLVDLMVYTIIVPVLPFRLQDLGYTGISGLTGWLLFAYSGALVIATLPIAAVSEKYANRQYLLVFGQIVLIGAQIMLMEARHYWLMVLARILQGASSSVIWVLGLALICDTTHESIQGRQLGIAVSGFSLGGFIGPPVGGALYGKFGIRGPFVFSILLTAVDFLLRCLIIERKHAIRYGIDPAAPSRPSEDAVEEASIKGDTKTSDAVATIDQVDTIQRDESQQVLESVNLRDQPLSLFGVLKVFLKSPRALATIYGTLTYGYVQNSQEPALPLYLEANYGLNSSKVGLVLLAGVIPTLVSAPVSGWLADIKGAELVSALATIIGIPWWGLITIKGPLWLFIFFYAILNFFLAAIVSPLTAELALIARSHRGIGYAHVYGAFNMGFGIGSAVGPIIGGQLYQHVKEGWRAICLLGVGLLSTSVVTAVCFVGEVPILKKFKGRLRKPPADCSAEEQQQTTLP